MFGFWRHGSGVHKGGCFQRSLRTFARRPTRLRRAVDPAIPGRIASQPEARPRFTGRMNRKRLSLQRQPLRTPEPCLQNPTADVRIAHSLRKSRMNRKKCNLMGKPVELVPWESGRVRRISLPYPATQSPCSLTQLTWQVASWTHFNL